MKKLGWGLMDNLVGLEASDLIVVFLRELHARSSETNFLLGN